MLKEKECKWSIKEASDSEKVDRLAAEVGIDKVLADLLVKRGVETFEQARSFFRPNLDDLHDPFLMKDMDVAGTPAQGGQQRGAHTRLRRLRR